MLSYLVNGLTLGFSAAVLPGPFQAYLLSQSARIGWRRTLPITLAPLLSDGPIIALVFLVLSRTPDWLLRGLYLTGGLFMFWLAGQAWRSFRRSASQQAEHPVQTELAFLQGVLMNILSPGPWLFWSVLAGPILLQGWAESPLSGFSFAVGFYLMLTGGLAGLVILFAVASRLGPQVARGLNALSALALLAFGLYQIRAGLRSGNH